MEAVFSFAWFIWERGRLSFSQLSTAYSFVLYILVRFIYSFLRKNRRLYWLSPNVQMLTLSTRYMRLTCPATRQTNVNSLHHSAISAPGHLLGLLARLKEYTEDCV